MTQITRLVPVSSNTAGFTDLGTIPAAMQGSLSVTEPGTLILWGTALPNLDCFAEGAYSGWPGSPYTGPYAPANVITSFVPHVPPPFTDVQDPRAAFIVDWSLLPPFCLLLMVLADGVTPPPILGFGGSQLTAHITRPNRGSMYTAAQLNTIAGTSSGPWHLWAIFNTESFPVNGFPLAVGAFQVTVSYDDGSGPAPTMPAVPAVPATAGICEDAQNTLTITPGDGGGTVTGFNVYRFGVLYGSVVNSGLATTTYVDTNVAIGTLYIYSVTAYGPGGESAQSSGVAVTPCPVGCQCGWTPAETRPLPCSWNRTETPCGEDS